jgi:hypothetical protein
VAPVRSLIVPCLIGAICCSILVTFSEPAQAQTPSNQLNKQASDIGKALFRHHIGPRIQDNIPLVSSSASYSFTYNIDLDVWERTQTTNGPILLERAETVGKGRFDLNVSYGYIHFNQINGRGFHNGLRKTDADGVTFTYRIREAEAQLANFTAIYGLTDDIDVSLVVPIERVSFGGQFLLNPPVLPASSVARFDHFGIADIELRAKWHAIRNDYTNVAVGTDLKLPSGNADKGLGVGDTRLAELLYASRTLLDNSIEPHATLGVEVDLDRARESRLIYGAGVTYQIWTSSEHAARGVSLTIDVAGKADLVPPARRDRGSFFGTSRQRNLLDVAPGLKVALSARALVFAAVELPLTNDDVRSDYTPLGGFELIF